MFLTNCIHGKLNICMKMDLALHNLQSLICHKTQPANTDIFINKASHLDGDIWLWSGLTRLSEAISAQDKLCDITSFFQCTHNTKADYNA